MNPRCAKHHLSRSSTLRYRAPPGTAGLQTGASTSGANPLKLSQDPELFASLVTWRFQQSASTNNRSATVLFFAKPVERVTLRFEAAGATVRSLCNFLNLEFEAGMLDYSDTPAPKGRMNDPVGIHQHSGPSPASLDKWKELGTDAQLRHFALEYLTVLGDETVAELGYDAPDLRRQIEGAAVAKQARHLYPWSLAIKPCQRWGLRDHIRSAYLRAAEKNGRLAGVGAALSIVAQRLGGGFTRLARWG